MKISGKQEIRIALVLHNVKGLNPLLAINRKEELTLSIKQSFTSGNEIRQSSYSVCSIYGNSRKHNLSSRKQFSCQLPKDIDNENIIYPSLGMCYYRTDELSHFSNGACLLVRLGDSATKKQ